jgi:BolA family transcriptional regulator, general stress-responsive regulator
VTLHDLICERLAALQPESLHLQDDSADHVGHSGNTGGGHFHLTIVSEQFEGKRTIERHRMVYQLLTDLMPHQIHALSIEALTASAFRHLGSAE